MQIGYHQLNAWIYETKIKQAALRIICKKLPEYALALVVNDISTSIKCAITACVLLSSPSHASTIQLSMDLRNQD
jgi:hypothetical protein